MALAFTVTLLADHKEITRPMVVGDEYVVDALVDVTGCCGRFGNSCSCGLSTIT